MANKKDDWSDNSGNKTYKDYSLLGKHTQIAKNKGLIAAEWYQSPIERRRLKELMKRKDWPGIRDMAIWFASLGGLGYLGYLSWGTWWSLLVFIIYGQVFYIAGSSRWHECSHYAAFKTAWLNEFFYHIAAFFVMRPGALWRWEHTRHHTDTSIVGRDPEIFVPRPPNFYQMIMNILNLDLYKREFVRAFRHAFGNMVESEKDIIPVTERSKVILEARIYLLVYTALVVLSFAMGSILPLLLVGLPAMYGAWITNTIFFSMEHGGLEEDVLDHRMCTRTVYINPVFRFLHWNMNYHLEHHMFPMIPYHALPALHKEIKKDCPEPLKGVAGVLKEVYPAFFIQLKDPTFTILRALPPTARPYSPHGPYKPKDASLDTLSAEIVL
jgi:fatty acid desaturase